MKKEDDIIKQKVGKSNAFTVPDGYFKHLTNDIMSKLPAERKTDFVVAPTTRWDRLKPFVYMAALFISAALIIRVASSGSKSKTIAPSQMELSASDVESDKLISEAMDRTMMDDYSMYEFLSSDSAENGNK